MRSGEYSVWYSRGMRAALHSAEAYGQIRDRAMRRRSGRGAGKGDELCIQLSGDRHV